MTNESERYLAQEYHCRTQKPSVLEYQFLNFLFWLATFWNRRPKLRGSKKSSRQECSQKGKSNRAKKQVKSSMHTKVKSQTVWGIIVLWVCMRWAAVMWIIFWRFGSFICVSSSKLWSLCFIFLEIIRSIPVMVNYYYFKYQKQREINSNLMGN